MKAPMILCSCLLAANAAAAVRPLVLGPSPLLAPSAPAVASLGAVLSPPLSLTALTPSLVPAPAFAAAAASRRIMAMRGAVKVRAELATSDTKTITEFNGAPSRVSELSEPGRVYRHWVLNKEAFEAILEQGLCAPVPSPTWSSPEASTPTSRTSTWTSRAPSSPRRSTRRPSRG